MNYLSKSDFKVARDCSTKLYYKKLRYPSSADDDPYMELLADGGFMVGKFAQILYPDGIEIPELDPEAAVKSTTDIMQRNDVTLFEAAFFADGLFARVDVLRKSGRHVELIEVKSKSLDPNEGIRGTRGAIRSDWMEYIEDVAYQRLVLQAFLPAADIECFLLVLDKTARCEIDELPTHFEIRREGRTALTEFHGNATELRRSRLLRLVPVDAEVKEVTADVREAARKMLPFVSTGPRRAQPKLGYVCRDCPYRVEAGIEPNGFRECWGGFDKVRPSILDLYQLGRVRGRRSSRLADELIEEGKVSLHDVPDAALTTAFAPRQRIQLKHTRTAAEWKSTDLRRTLEALPYPLHFVDFETSRLALPYHRGMHPFEQVAFQWSCHTIARPGGELQHVEWINVASSFPSIAFAQALRDAIGDEGTLLTWSHHEATTLKDIARQIGVYDPGRSELARWLLASAERTFDLCRHAEQHYFHPDMGGSVSIKRVLPSVWRANKPLRGHPWFSHYAREENGQVLDPYATLPALEIFDQAEVVDEGTGAMRAYQEMLYGAGRHNPAIRDKWRSLLLQYCALDTLAMVIIWKHWTT